MAVEKAIISEPKEAKTQEEIDKGIKELCGMSSGLSEESVLQPGTYEERQLYDDYVCDIVLVSEPTTVYSSMDYNAELMLRLERAGYVSKGYKNCATGY
jgi:hypothetical protein